MILIVDSLIPVGQPRRVDDVRGDLDIVLQKRPVAVEWIDQERSQNVREGVEKKLIPEGRIGDPYRIDKLRLAEIGQDHAQRPGLHARAKNAAARTRAEPPPLEPVPKTPAKFTDGS